MQDIQEMQVQSLGREDPLRGGKGQPLQYSCLKNFMGRGAWQATGKQSDTTERLNTHTHKYRSSIWKSTVLLRTLFFSSILDHGKQYLLCTLHKTKTTPAEAGYFHHHTGASILSSAESCNNTPGRHSSQLQGSLNPGNTFVDPPICTETENNSWNSSNCSCTYPLNKYFHKTFILW